MKEPVGGEDLALLLASWKGATAYVWAFDISHKKFTIRLHRDDVVGNVHVVCVATRSIAGPTQWQNAELQILRGAEWSGLVDYKVGFSLVCSDIVAAENVDPLY